MLKHRRRDLEFRDGIHERQKKTEVDSQALIDKLARKEAKIQSIDKDRYLLKNQIKEKDDEIRAIKNAQKSTIRDKQANHTQIEQKLVRSEIELKKSKAQITKLQD